MSNIIGVFIAFIFNWEGSSDCQSSRYVAEDSCLENVQITEAEQFEMAYYTSMAQDIATQCMLGEDK